MSRITNPEKKYQPETERNAEICRLRAEKGWTYQQLADHFGIAKSRAQAIITKNRPDLVGSVRSRRKTQELVEE